MRVLASRRGRSAIEEVGWLGGWLVVNLILVANLVFIVNLVLVANSVFIVNLVLVLLLIILVVWFVVCVAEVVVRIRFFSHVVDVQGNGECEERRTAMVVLLG